LPLEPPCGAEESGLEPPAGVRIRAARCGARGIDVPVRNRASTFAPPRKPRASPLWQCVSRHLPELRAAGRVRRAVAGWLRNDLRDFTLEHLQGRSSVTRQYYDAAALDRVLDEHLRGKKSHEILLWTLLNVEIWQRMYAPG
jgi:hypothetical protein